MGNVLLAGLGLFTTTSPCPVDTTLDHRPISISFPQRKRCPSFPPPLLYLSIMSKPEHDPSITVGSTVHIKTTFGDVYQGKIFAFDAKSATLTLVEDIKHTTINVNKRVIKTQFIADINLICQSNGNDSQKLTWPTQTVVKDRLKRAMEAARKSEKMLGKNVSQLAQTLMDHLGKQ